MKAFKVAAGVAAFAAGLTLASAAPADEPADGFVFDAMTAPATVSYAGTVEVRSAANQQSEASVYHIEHRAPNLTARSYLSPPDLRGDSIVSRGDASYFVDVRRHRVVQTENDASKDQIARDDNYLLLRANYRAVKQASEPFAGRRVRTVALINRYTHRTTMLVRIDEATKLVLDKQQFAPDGSLVSEMRFRDVRYTADLSDGDFSVPKEFALVRGPKFDEASKDVAQVVRSTKFEARGPRFLPEGFSPIEGDVIDVRSVPTLHLLYSDGIRTVSLFENAGATGLDLQRWRPHAIDVAGHAAQFAEQGPTALLTWTDGSLHCALVGELDLGELKHIAASLGP